MHLHRLHPAQADPGLVFQNALDEQRLSTARRLQVAVVAASVRRQNLAGAAVRRAVGDPVRRAVDPARPAVGPCVGIAVRVAAGSAAEWGAGRTDCSKSPRSLMDASRAVCWPRDSTEKNSSKVGSTFRSASSDRAHLLGRRLASVVGRGEPRPIAGIPSGSRRLRRPQWYPDHRNAVRVSGGLASQLSGHSVLSRPQRNPADPGFPGSSGGLVESDQETYVARHFGYRITQSGVSLRAELDTTGQERPPRSTK